MNGENLISAFRKVRKRLVESVSRIGDDNLDDALQEAFCRAWAHRGSITDYSHAEGVLMTATRRICIDNTRHQASHPVCSIDSISETPNEMDPGNDFLDLYKKVDRLASQNLSPRDREILFHRDRDGWDFEDLASSYNLSEANVRMIVSRARKTIREIYRTKKQES